MKPHANEYPAYYAKYIDALGDVDLTSVLTSQLHTLTALSSLTEEQALYRYAEGKWSIKEVLGHLIDCERVFAFRAMSIARGEQQPLPGFDENAYVAHASFDAQPVSHLIEELISVRHATITLLRSLTPDEHLRSGVANGNPITVRALFWIIAGHVKHHAEILTTRYL
ncbi:MAG: DinB family protein [Candidatus Kapabacteria bacterium]|nr:DinB family protein [Candidatus Kapabacteria bacterium]